MSKFQSCFISLDYWQKSPENHSLSFWLKKSYLHHSVMLVSCTNFVFVVIADVLFIQYLSYQERRDSIFMKLENLKWKESWLPWSVYILIVLSCSLKACFIISCRFPIFVSRFIIFLACHFLSCISNFFNFLTNWVFKKLRKFNPVAGLPWLDKWLKNQWLLPRVFGTHSNQEGKTKTTMNITKRFFSKGQGLKSAGKESKIICLWQYWQIGSLFLA